MPAMQAKAAFARAGVWLPYMHAVRFCCHHYCCHCACTDPWAILLAMITMVKSIHQFHFISYNQCIMNLYWPNGKRWWWSQVQDHVYLRYLWSSVNQHPWSTLDRYLTDTLIDTQWTLDQQHLGQQLVKSQLSFADMPLSVNQYRWVNQHLAANCWSSVNQYIDRVSTECPLSVDQMLIEMSTKG